MAANMGARMRRFAFVSSNVSWGGSEDLWSEAAIALARAGHIVTAYKNVLDPHEDAVARLRDAGCRIVELARVPVFPRTDNPLLARLPYPLTFGWQASRLWLALKARRRPDLVVVSQGGNHDGWLFANVCRRLGYPYALISQKATDLYWPVDGRRKWMRSAYEGARHAFFVSDRNRRLTEEQLGAPLARASVVRNPFKVPWRPQLGWPGTDLGYRFACVGRIWVMEKGQDILLRVLARDKWRARPVGLSLYGAGANAEGLEAMAAYQGLDNVRFAGFTDDVQAIWASHHALVMPSRAEGLPLALVEAMLCARVAIATDVAGSGEAVADNVTGFLAAAASEDALDEAMERAWQRREDWPRIGARAADAIRRLVPPDPAGELAKQLLRLAEGGALEPEASARAAEPLAGSR